MTRWGFVLLLGLAGCAAQTPAFQVETYEGERLYLNVRDVRVHPAFTAPAAADHIESSPPVTPQRALETWAKNRFFGAARASNISAIITIADASLTQRVQPAGLRPDMVQYTLSYRIELAFLKGIQPAFKSSVGGTETREVLKLAPESRHRHAWADMINAMLEKADAAVAADIPKAYLMDE